MYILQVIKNDGSVRLYGYGAYNKALASAILKTQNDGVDEAIIVDLKKLEVRTYEMV